MSKKEKRGIYNVTYGNQKETLIKTDVELVEEAIIDEIIRYVSGKHIRLEHTQDETQLGFVTLDEVANIGQNVRKYINEYGKSKKGGVIWCN